MTDLRVAPDEIVLPLKTGLAVTRASILDAVEAEFAALFTDLQKDGHFSGTCPVMDGSVVCLQPLTAVGPGAWTCSNQHYLTARPELRPVGGIGAAS